MIVIILVIALCISLSAGQGISAHPSNTTVFAGWRAVFFCTTRDAAGHWKLNGTGISDLSSALRADTQTESTRSAVFYFLALSILGRVEYNHTRVHCEIENEDGQSDIAVLSVQGVLAPVGGLIFNKSSSSVTISWSAPWSLEVTGVDHDIRYSVLIQNVADEERPTDILCTDCTNITETHYTFTPDHLSPCHKYLFSVVPHNGAGQGMPSNKSSSLHDYPITFFGTRSLFFTSNLFISKISSGVYKVLIAAPLFVNSTVLCFQESLALHYGSDKEECPTQVSTVTPELVTPEDKGEEEWGVWHIESEVKLGDNCEYIVSLISFNGTGETNFSGILITTTVIRVDVQYHDGEVMVTCMFKHTLSQKCYVLLVSGGFYQAVCVEGSYSFTGLSAATYSVLVYGMTGEESCPSISRDPDYITAVSLSGSSSATPVIYPPTVNTGTQSPRSSHPLCGAGLGVGVALGVTVTCLTFLTSIVIIKLTLTRQKKRKGLKAVRTKVPMERNMAYELHKPPLPRQGLK